MRVKQMIILGLLFLNIELVYAAKNQEDSSGTDSAEASLVINDEVGVSNDPEVILEESSDVAFVESNNFDYLDAFKHYYSKNKFKGVEEVLWQLSDKDYEAIKNNDFQYEKIKNTKIKEYEEQLNVSNFKANTYRYRLVLQVGPYNFKSEKFPVTGFRNNEAFSSFGLNDKWENVSYSIFNPLFFRKNIQHIPEDGVVVFPDLKKRMSEILVKKDIAEKFSSQFDFSRSIHCLLYANNPVVSTLTVNKLFNKNKVQSFKVSLNLSKIECFYDAFYKQYAFEI